MPQVICSVDLSDASDEARAEAIALALMGVGDLPDALLAENAVWDRADGALSGRHAIQSARITAPHAEKIRVEQVVTQGTAGSVSGRVTRAGKTWLYCHVIRYTNPAAQQIAQLVSFEHAGDM